ncbi:hypothetical protein CAPTEDRAFT_92160 [Capitella teleta]|uniref:Major facilitator superfamily (MFS) profile domain-containing protein n=1 Tax=Capitella teleta TaxID=283909 RepID=R7TQX5_CAPTE|nr:hypothetical protein CAPTEDRAFT_92160 [Capitella teleta]|eukprot:ELT95977.1 hypothetical protein CAPTEDRAFT_92160 [Capitella teleta]
MRLIDLWLALALISAAVGTAIAPWCRTLQLLGFMFSMDGLGKGITASASSAFILQLWEERAGVPTQCLHFAFGVGALLVPQIAHIRLGNTTSLDNGTHIGLRSIELDNSTSSFVRREGDQIEIAYGIAAGVTLLNALVFLVMLFGLPRPVLSSSRKQQSFKEVCNPASCIKGDKVVGMLIIAFLFLFWGMPIGAERAYGKFIFVYAVIGPAQMAKAQATILETVFWTTFVLGRFLAIVFSNFVSPTKLLIGDLAITVVATSLLAALQQNIYVLWICTAVFASMISPVFPSAIAWANLYIEMTPMATSVAFISSASADFAYSWISGWLFEYKGPPSLMYFMVAYALVSCTFFSVLVILGRLHRSRVHDEVEDEQMEVEAVANGAKEVEMDLMKSN